MKDKRWDKYFLGLAKEVSKNSKCLSRKIGAVLVKDKSVISTGYNGPARGVKHCSERNLFFYNDLEGTRMPKKDYTIRQGQYPVKCPRRFFGYGSGEGLHLCQAGHAERNALIQAGRNGISTKGTTLYCWCPMPCKECAIEIVNAGVDTLVILEGPVYDEYSKVIFEESGINIRVVKDENLLGN